MASVTGYEAIMQANTAAGLTHTAGMNTAQAREYQTDQNKAYARHKLNTAHANGFRTVAEWDACFDYAHGAAA